MNATGKTIGQVMDAPIPKVKDLARGRKDVVSFAQGLPWFGPPADSLARTLERVQKGEADRYGEVPGRMRLRELLAEDLERRGIAGIDPGTICVTPGANQAIFISLAAVADPGDEVILFKPYYFNNLMALQMLGLKPVFVPSGPDGTIDSDALKHKICRRTRALIVISPNNPTGSILETDARESLSKLAREHGLMMLSDEAYRDFAWEKPHVSFLAETCENLVGIGSFSKSYGMSGWRLGFLTAEPAVIAGAIKAADTLHICPPQPAQLLAEDILAANPDYPARFREDMMASRDRLVAALQPLWEQELIGGIRSAGGFYVFLRLFPEEPQSGWDIARRLIDEFSLAVIPGESFGADKGPFIRLSYGNIRSAEMAEPAARLSRALEAVLRK